MGWSSSLVNQFKPDLYGCSLFRSNIEFVDRIAHAYYELSALALHQGNRVVTGRVSTLGGSISGLRGGQQQPAIVANQKESEYGYCASGNGLKYSAHRYGPTIWFAWAVGWTLFGAFVGSSGWILAIERGHRIIGWALFFLGLSCGGFGAWSLIYGWPWPL